ADADTTAKTILRQARELNRWIPNAHIKLPITHVGLASAQQLVSEGIRVNMTLCFSQEQAAAVHAATRGAKKGDVFVSPFVGRLDDIGENGMDLIKNIRKMYDEAGSHVEVLAASIRSMDHFLTSFDYNADIVTAPSKILKEWTACRSQTSAGSLTSTGLKSIPYRQLDLSKHWRDFDISHPLTDKGIEKFAADWNALIK
ncbi:MAG: transaldolase family protein, partial [Patescibacteria group bacterium]